MKDVEFGQLKANNCNRSCQDKNKEAVQLKKDFSFRTYFSSTAILASKTSKYICPHSKSRQT